MRAAVDFPYSDAGCERDDGGHRAPPDRWDGLEGTSFLFLTYHAGARALTWWGTTMRYLIALLLPWLVFFTMGKIVQGILCLILQLTLIGWVPAALWAVMSVSNYHAKQRDEKLIQEIEKLQNR